MKVVSLTVLCLALAGCWTQARKASDIETESRLLKDLRQLLLQESRDVENRARKEYVRIDGKRQYKEAEDDKATLKRGVAQRVNEASFYLDDGTEVTKSVEEMCMYAHNTVRNLHMNTPALVWNQALADGSAQHAAELVERDDLEYSEEAGRNYLENLFYFKGRATANPAQAVYAWYAESWKPGYNYETGGFQESGRFVQLIWKGVTSVGCGAYKKQENDGYVHTVIVARYQPKPTFENFRDNVNAPKVGASGVIQNHLSKLIEGEGCKNIDKPDMCQLMKDAGYCFQAKITCECDCGN